MPNNSKPSLIHIIQSDYLAQLGVLFPVITFGMWMIFVVITLWSKSGALPQQALIETSIFIIMFIVSSLIGVPLVVWRIRYIQHMFLIGIPITGQITQVSFYRDRGKVEYSYSYQGQTYAGNNAVVITNQVKHLQAASPTMLLVHPDQPKRALIRDLYHEH